MTLMFVLVCQCKDPLCYSKLLVFPQLNHSNFAISSFDLLTTIRVFILTQISSRVDLSLTMISA